MRGHMKILYLHQYFKTNLSGGGTRSYEFSDFLSKNGIEVNVITGTEIAKEYRNENNGLTIYTTNTSYSNNMSKWRRILAFMEYNLRAFLKGLTTKDIDIIFATSTPLTIGLPAVLLAKIWRKKLIFEVRDVWPDIPIELGYIKNILLVKMLKTFERWIYENSDHIIVLSEGMLNNLIGKGVDNRKISVIENMSNLYLFDTIVKSRTDERFTDKFICIHPGTMGHVNGLDYLLDVAKHTLAVDKNVLFLLVGEGNRKEHLKRRIAEENLLNVIIEDMLPKREIAEVIKSSDIGIMCVENKYKILEDNSANKFFDFLAAGLPILINYKGWQKTVIEKANCGKSELDPKKMAQIIVDLKHDPELRKTMGNNARNLAEHKYSDKIAKQKLLDIIKDLFKESNIHGYVYKNKK